MSPNCYYKRLKEARQSRIFRLLRRLQLLAMTKKTHFVIHITKKMNSEILQIETKSFLQKRKNLIIVFIIGLIIIALFLFVLPVLFCPNLNDYLDQGQEYTSCVEDSDCIPKTSGCLNEKGAEKFKLFNFLCKPWSNCLAPSACLCENKQCAESYGLFEQ